jgi:hypothetical protein
MRFRAGAVSILFIVFSQALPVAAQETHTVTGRVVNRSDNSALPGISVTTGDGRTALTDDNGRFRIREIPSGRLILQATGLGYLPADTALVILNDTTVTIAMEPAPIGLAPLTGDVRFVTIRGDVVEEKNRAMVVDAEVTATADRKTTTNVAGRFKLARVPTGAPFQIRVGSFGYLPETLTFEPQRDTTFEIVLREDPVAQAIIREQLKKIDTRSEDRRYKVLPVLDRDALLAERDNGLIMDIIHFRLGSIAAKRIQCIVVDDDPAHLWRQNHLLADEVQRVEIVRYGLTKEGLMVRIYTREYIRDLAGGAEELVPREVAMFPGTRRTRSVIERMPNGTMVRRLRTECR